MKKFAKLYDIDDTQILIYLDNPQIFIITTVDGKQIKMYTVEEDNLDEL